MSFLLQTQLQKIPLWIPLPELPDEALRSEPQYPRTDRLQPPACLLQAVLKPLSESESGLLFAGPGLGPQFAGPESEPQFPEEPESEPQFPEPESVPEFPAALPDS